MGREPYLTHVGSYIPRLQVVPEEQENTSEGREITAKLLREHDKTWEESRARELGNRAILGPKTSPVKRTKNQEEETSAPKNKKRRRKLKHGVLEDWGMLPQLQGAAEGAPQASTSMEPNSVELSPPPPTFDC